MAERDVAARVKRYLAGLEGCWCYKAADRWTAGVPDIVGVYRGRFFGLECKTRRGRLRPLQAYTLLRIRLAGGIAGVVRSVAEARRLLEEVTDDGRRADGEDGRGDGADGP